MTNGKSPNRDSAMATTATIVFMSPTTTAEETGFPLRTNDFEDRSIDDDVDDDDGRRNETIVGAL